jgi:hypothetical protein
MQSVNIQTHVGPDGILRLEIPTNLPEQDLQVLVIYQQTPDPPTLTQEEWSPDFFEKVIGSWEGEPLTRGEQGQYEEREILE